LEGERKEKELRWEREDTLPREREEEDFGDAVRRLDECEEAEEREEGENGLFAGVFTIGDIRLEEPPLLDVFKELFEECEEETRGDESDFE
jgi:hypothetical protein